MDYEKKYKEALEKFVDIQGYEGLYKVNIMQVDLFGNLFKAYHYGL